MTLTSLPEAHVFKVRRFSLVSSIMAIVALVATVPSSAQTQKSGWAGGGGESFFSPLNVDWWYNWGLDENAGSGDAAFFPMFWGGVNQNGIDKVLNKPFDVEYVLGFNEPERSDQANMTVATALSEWRELVDGLDGSGIKLVSPAPSDTGDGRAWLIDFMNGVDADPNLHVDAVAFHWYGVNNPNNPAGAANNFLNRVQWYYDQFDLPVFITEFGIHDWGENYTDAEIQEANRQFLDIVGPVLEQRDYVAGYSPFPWFSDLRLVEGTAEDRIATGAGEVYAGLYEQGETFDLFGIDQGSDIIYLRGGTLTNTSRGDPTVGSIYALSETSEIDGVGWSATQELRVATGATLSKTGAGSVAIVDAELNIDGSLIVSEGELVFENTGVSNGAGRTWVEPGATLRFIGPGRGPSFGSDVTLNGGELVVEGAATFRNGFDVEADSTLSVDQLVNVSGGLRSNGSGQEGDLRKTGPGLMTVGSSPGFSRSLIVEEGTVRLNPGASFEAAESISVAEGATFDATLLESGLALIDQDASLAGRFEGDLSLSGNSVLEVTGSDATIANDLVLSETAVVRIALDGSKLSIDGAIDIHEASLELTADEPVAAGQRFDLLDWSTATGVFGDFLFPALAADAAWSTTDLATSGELATVLAGDFNGDGAVDAADYTVWRDKESVAVERWSAGDANGDGSVDEADYALWAANFGNRLAPLGSAVPEPATALGLMTAISLAWIARRKRV